MEATIGDKICIHGNTVGHADKHGEIIEVRGDRGEPPYVVRFPDGQERTIFPGPDAYIIPRQRQSPLLSGGALVVSGVVTLGLAVLAFVAFLASVIADPRSFRNAVLLGLALALGTLGLADRLADMPGRSGHLLLLGLVLLVALGPFLAACYLVANGVTMARRESLRPANLLPLVAGAGILTVIGLNLAAERTGSVKLGLLATVTTLVFGYVSFLLVSYVLYAWLYSQAAGRASRAEYVIVLGTGLGKRGQVTPLLASRLERGREVWAALTARGGRPVMIVSGGQGSDERTTEAAAMAAYLTERGFPADQLACEDRSGTTEENLAFSKAIMDAARPGGPDGRGARCVIVTSNYHVFRTAIIARKAGIRGQVTGSRTAGYYWPSAMLREFAAVFLRYWLANLAICSALVLAPVADALAGRI